MVTELDYIVEQLDVKELAVLIELAKNARQREADLKYPRLMAHEMELIQERRYIHAIKAYRDRTGLGLWESKFVVDCYRERI